MYEYLPPHCSHEFAVEEGDKAIHVIVRNRSKPYHLKAHIIAILHTTHHYEVPPFLAVVLPCASFPHFQAPILWTLLATILAVNVTAVAQAAALPGRPPARPILEAASPPVLLLLLLCRRHLLLYGLRRLPYYGLPMLGLPPRA